MSSFDFSKKDVLKIGLFGLGKSNIGVAEYLRKKYRCEFVIRSDKVFDKAKIPSFMRACPLYIGGEAYSDLGEDILFLSPSVKRDNARLLQAEKNGLVLSSDAELFFERAKCPIFAVSGSDGKSTTTELVNLLLKTKYPCTLKSGNCGAAMTPMLDLESDGAIHTVELSSFMLEYMTPRTKRAHLTGISENHLDWHGDFASYISAKENLLKRTEGAVLWYDDGICRDFIGKYPTFALLSTDKNSRFLSRLGCEICLTLEGGKIKLNGREILSCDRVRRGEPHNIKNLMSAIALCWGYFDIESLSSVAESFCGIAHRCQSIGSFSGVEFINSSIDSSPMRTAVTLTGLNRSVIIILGGRGKGLSYSPLSEPLKKFAKAIVLTGENRHDISSELADTLSSVPAYEAENFDTAVLAAIRLSERGDTVLLSPASASYDEFPSFEFRGERFSEIIRNFYGK